MKKIFLLVGRICLSLVFVTAVANKILNWEGAHQYFVAVLGNWLSYPALPDLLRNFCNILLTHSQLFLLLGAIFEGVGGVLVLLGIKVRLGASLLILFLIPTTILMHAFWFCGGAEQQIQMANFFKNLSILGGLFILIAFHGGGE